MFDHLNRTLEGHGQGETGQVEEGQHQGQVANSERSVDSPAKEMVVGFPA